MLRAAPHLTLALLALPVIGGCVGTLLPAIGVLPSLGHTEPSLDAVRALLAWPGLVDAVALSIFVGGLATVLSLMIAMLVVASWQGTTVFRWLMRLMAPILSVPHAAAALGLAFLIAPSGWAARLASPLLTGWETPPDILIVQHPSGLPVVFALVLKEVPFLLLMTMAALGQADGRRRRLLAETLGHDRVTGWFLTVFPSVYAQIRLPVFAVLAYSMSVIDVALVLGPTRPAPLSVQVLHWMNHPDLDMRLQAGAGALLQFVLVVGALGVWVMAEKLVAHIGRSAAQRGARGWALPGVRVVSLSVGVLAAGLVMAGLAGLAIWSFAGLWSFPAVLPDGFTLRTWTRQSTGSLDALRETALIGLAATGISGLLVTAVLEAEHRFGLGRPKRALWLLYLPLIVPQIAFLPGLQAVLLALGIDGGRMAVIGAHLVFVLPYVYLSFGDSWRAWDSRQGVVAQTLGAGHTRVLLTVRLPMLLRALLIALAVGFAVSVGQYLPTLLVGGGRVETLTTEAIALSSGGNRRVIGVYVFLQMIAPFVVFAVALGGPAILFRNRRGLESAT